MALANIRNAHGLCPKESLAFLVDLIKYNDNNRNKVSYKYKIGSKLLVTCCLQSFYTNQVLFDLEDPKSRNLIRFWNSFFKRVFTDSSNLPAGRSQSCTTQDEKATFNWQLWSRTWAASVRYARVTHIILELCPNMKRNFHSVYNFILHRSCMGMISDFSDHI